MARKKKRRGHYCKGCGEFKANEKFTGKGRSQHLCKECKKRGITSEEDLFESDETFAFIAGYTESGIPFGITHEEWELEEKATHDKSNEIRVNLSEEMTEKLHSIFNDQSMEKSIYASIAITLFITNRIKLERAAYLVDSSFTDFIGFLHENNVSWTHYLNDGHTEYQRSLPDLLTFVDNIVEEDDREGN